jgi:hypothetical protein
LYLNQPRHSFHRQKGNFTVIEFGKFRWALVLVVTLATFIHTQSIGTTAWTFFIVGFLIRFCNFLWGFGEKIDHALEPKQVVNNFTLNAEVPPAMHGQPEHRDPTRPTYAEWGVIDAERWERLKKT